jgi:hypothetical protein
MFDAIVEGLEGIFNFIVDNPMIIVVIIAAIILYALVNHLVFRYRGYQPREKTMCALSVAGKERSLEYLRDFTQIPPEQLEIVKYLRSNEPVSTVALSKRFGKHNVEALIHKEYIVLT